MTDPERRLLLHMKMITFFDYIVWYIDVNNELSKISKFQYFLNLMLANSSIDWNDILKFVEMSRE